MSAPSGKMQTQTRPSVGDTDEDQFAIHVLVTGFRCANGHVSRSLGLWLQVDRDVVTISCNHCDTEYAIAPIRSAPSQEGS